MGRPIRNNLLSFEHDADAFEHPKFLALRAHYGTERGWSMEARFWALNGMVANAEDCRLDLSRPFAKAAVVQKLGLTEADLDEFLAFLSDREACGLASYEAGILTTDRTQDELKSAQFWRSKDRARKMPVIQTGSNGKDQYSNGTPAENDSSPGGKHPENGVFQLPVPSRPVPTGTGKAAAAEPDTSPHARDGSPSREAPPQEPAAAFQSRLKSTLKTAGIELSQRDVEGIAARLIVAPQIGPTGDVEGFMSWACARAKREAKTPAPGSYLALCMAKYSGDWLARWEQETAASRAKAAEEAKRCPECKSKVGHLYTCSQSLQAKAEREARESAPPASSAEQAPDTFPDDIPEPAAKVELDIF